MKTAITWKQINGKDGNIKTRLYRHKDTFPWNTAWSLFAAGPAAFIRANEQEAASQ